MVHYNKKVKVIEKAINSVRSTIICSSVTFWLAPVFTEPVHPIEFKPGKHSVGLLGPDIYFFSSECALFFIHENGGHLQIWERWRASMHYWCLFILIDISIVSQTAKLFSPTFAKCWDDSDDVELRLGPPPLQYGLVCLIIYIYIYTYNG